VGQYLPVVALAILAILFAGVSRVASKLLAPSHSTAPKRSPYECGIVPGRETLERFPVRFYLIAMIFIVFDIEIIFLYPWAVIYRDLGAFGLVEVLIFSVAVVVSFAYLLANGALDWGPAKRMQRIGPMVSADRTAATTVRRVGLDGLTAVAAAAAPSGAGEAGGEGAAA
jgi:NADH-quinone oxidoreductase subunit A